MAIPEISHRCALCGAAIRVGAVSCPNCGQDEPIAAPRYEPAPAIAVTLADEPLEQVSQEVAPPEELAVEEPETANDEFVAEADNTATTAAQDLAPELSIEPQTIENPAIAPLAPAPTVKILDGPPPVYKRRRRRYQPPTMKERLAHRVEQLRGASKDATRKVAPKVEQLRETSNIVLDRADTDPSARFLLIGALLTAIAAFVFIVSFFWG